MFSRPRMLIPIRICFQVPAITREFGITLVVSPLKGLFIRFVRTKSTNRYQEVQLTDVIALMLDQVTGLIDRGIPAAFLQDTTPAHELAKVS